MIPKSTIESLCPSMAIIEEVAAIDGTDPTELPPLYEVIDPEALDALVESASESEFEVEFPYSGHEVTVTGDGEIHIEQGRPEQSVA